MANRPYLSALIPVYNEEENLPALGEEVSAALNALHKPYEVILVDDGSKDRSWDELQKLIKKYPHFKAVRLGRNAGQTAAMLAGIQASTGELIVCLDADMQNDARDVPKLLAKMNEGYDCVSGWR
ncbi:MAG: glycosyltransferase family 2 protein, partial [Elusimicrobiota bacterium]